MKMFLIDHEERCVPLAPCRSCVAASFLREKLTPEELAAFLALMKGTAEATIGLDESLDALHLPARVLNPLLNSEIRTIRDVLAKTEQELLRVPNFGKKVMGDLDAALLKRGRRRGEPIPQ
ncbi:hypothetical protein K8Q93_03250 [Candidatus Parcubacteria bacterium]|nr:hypothetical protein [Candidatus Parcubacteria bacterium]